MKIKYLVLACLVAVLLFSSLAIAGLTDLVYNVGKDQVMGRVTQVAAQNKEAQSVLDVYNMVSSDSKVAYGAQFAQKAVCQEQGEFCSKLMQASGMFSQFSRIAQDPSQLPGLAGNALCTQNQETCNIYNQAMGYYGQASGITSNPTEFVKSFAMGKLASQLNPEIGGKIWQIMSYKRYLDLLTLDSDKKEQSNASSAVTAQATAADVLIGRDYMGSGKCVVGINLLDGDKPASTEDSDVIAYLTKGEFPPGVFGNVENCRTMQDATDISGLFGKRKGTVVLGKGCTMNRLGGTMNITTEDAAGKAAFCTLKIGVPNVGINAYESLIGGEEKGPEGTTIRSGSFVLDNDGTLLHAEFKAAMDKEYVFDGKKYKLQKGATVIYDRKEGEEKGKVRFGFEGLKSPKIEIFSFAKGGWEKAPSAVITPVTLSPVKVELLDSGLYKVSGKFSATGLNEFILGESSSAIVDGVNVRSTTKAVHFSKCKKTGEGNWIDYCKSGKVHTLEAKGLGFSFSEPGQKNYYYLKSGKTTPEVSVALEELGKGRYVSKFQTLRGNVVFSEGQGFLEVHEGELKQSLSYSSYELAVSDATGKGIKTLGAGGVRDALLAQSAGLAAPDAIKGLNLPEPTSEAGMTLLPDAGLVAVSSMGSTCIMSANEPAAITAAAILDVTGRITLEEIKQNQAEMQKLMNNCAEKKEGTVVLNSPSEPAKPVVELRGIIFKDLYINDREITGASYDTKTNKILLYPERKEGDKPIIYYVDATSRQVYNKDVIGLSVEYTPAGIKLNDPQYEKAVDLLSSEDEAALEEKSKAETLQRNLESVFPGGIYIVETANADTLQLTPYWRFRYAHGKWGYCEKLKESNPNCPDTVTGWYIKCVDTVGRQFLWPLEKAVGDMEECPKPAKKYQKRLF